MVYFKACPRCHGDLYPERDAYGPFRSCLQCGYILDLRPAAPTLAPAATPQEVAYAHAA